MKKKTKKKSRKKATKKKTSWKKVVVGKPEVDPIRVVEPLKARMEAVCSLARGIEKLATALQTSPTVNITDCTIIGSKGTAISIGAIDGE